MKSCPNRATRCGRESLIEKIAVTYQDIRDIRDITEYVFEAFRRKNIRRTYRGLKVCLGFNLIVPTHTRCNVTDNK